MVGRLISYEYAKIARKSSELLCTHPDLDNFGLPLEQDEDILLVNIIKIYFLYNI